MSEFFVNREDGSGLQTRQQMLEGMDRKSMSRDEKPTLPTPREDEVERHAKDLALATELEQLGCDEAAKRLRTLTIWACGPNGVRWYIEKLQEAQKALATLTPREQRMEEALRAIIEWAELDDRDDIGFELIGKARSALSLQDKT